MQLTLTTPHTKSKAVRQAQQLLVVNAFKTNFLRDLVDGEFGEATARACIRARHWLGFPKKAEQHPVWTPRLEKMLMTGKLPPLYRVRRRRRLKAKQSPPLRVAALKAAQSMIGVKESPPDSNEVRFTRWYDAVGPWCAMFTTWAYVKAGSESAFERGERWAYCPYMLADAKAGRNHLQVIKGAEAKPGDVVLYDWEGNGVPDHVGLFEEWKDGSSTTFLAIEGNTAVGNDSNGGEVMRRERTTSLVSAFVRVGG